MAFVLENLIRSGEDSSRISADGANKPDEPRLLRGGAVSRPSARLSLSNSRSTFNGPGACREPAMKPTAGLPSPMHGGVFEGQIPRRRAAKNCKRIGLACGKEADADLA